MLIFLRGKTVRFVLVFLYVCIDILNIITIPSLNLEMLRNRTFHRVKLHYNYLLHSET